MKTVNGLIGVAVLSVAGALPAQAQETQWTPKLGEGTQEVSVSGRLEFPDLERLDYDLDLSYGYFLEDGWEVGTQVGASDFGGSDRLDITLFTEYNFMREQWWVPYVGAAIGIGSVSFDGNDFDSGTNLDDEEGWVFDIEAGIKWFVRPYMAISTAFNFQFATDDIYATDDNVEDNLTSLQIGMRFYF